MSRKRPASKEIKLELNHESKRLSISIPVDHSLYNLKQTIHTQLGLSPEEQILEWGGRQIVAEDGTSLKQAKIPNNSKITVNRRAPMRINEDDDKNMKKLEDIVRTASDVIRSVHSLEKERRRILYTQEDDQKLENPDQGASLRRLKLECEKNGEQLIRLLESVDQISFNEMQTDHRGKRKQVATKLNYVLDQNDKIIEKLAGALQNGC